MPTYDTSFDPPAPVATAQLRNRAEDLVVGDVPLFIDSGGDLTLVPREAVEEIKADLTDEVFELTGFDGGTSLARAVQLDLTFMRRTFRGHYLVVDRSYGILGRDILNQVAIFLDGPRLTWGPLGPRRSA